MKFLPLLTLLFLNSPAMAESTFESMVRVYNDSETQVITPHARASASILKDSVVIGAGFAEDIVTSASADVKSWASNQKISDTRKEESGDVTFDLQNGAVTANFIESDENDYHSQTYGLSTTRDFFQKNTTLDLGVGLGIDNIKHSKDTNFSAFMQTQAVSIGLTQVLSPISIFQILYDFRAENGFLSGSYRVGRIAQPDGSVIGMPENSPNSRIRNSFAFKYNYFMRSINASLASTFRFYVDTWDVKSGTLEERISKDFSKRFTGSFNFRYYQQTAANFYQDKYDLNALPVFITGNKTLAAYSTVLAGVRPTFRFGKNWEAYGKVEYYIEQFTNFTDVGDPQNPNDDKMYALKALVLGAGFSGKF